MPAAGERERAVELRRDLSGALEQTAGREQLHEAARRIHRPHGVGARGADADLEDIENAETHAGPSLEARRRILRGCGARALMIELRSRQNRSIANGENSMIRHTIGRSALLAGIILAAAQVPAAQAPPLPDYLRRPSPIPPVRPPMPSAMRTASPRRRWRSPGSNPDSKSRSCCRAAATSRASSARAVGSTRPRLCAGAGAASRCAGRCAGFRGARQGTRRRPELFQRQRGGRALRRAQDARAGRSGVDLPELSRPAQFPGPESHGVQSNGIRGAEAGRHLSHPGSCLGAGGRHRGHGDLAQDRPEDGQAGSARRRLRIRRQQQSVAPAIGSAYGKGVRPLDPRPDRSVHLEIPQTRSRRLARELRGCQLSVDRICVDGTGIQRL